MIQLVRSFREEPWKISDDEYVGRYGEIENKIIDLAVRFVELVSGSGRIRLVEFKA
jgi:hypothetical protein